MPPSPDPIERLAHELVRLPGVGRRMAERLAYHLLSLPGDEPERLASAIETARREVSACPECGHLSALSPCRFCADPRREDRLLCVVEEVPDLLAVEASGEFRGRYHVLGGVLSPLNGVGPERLRLSQLVERVARLKAAEVIVATNPSVDGETTSLYIKKVLAPLGVRVTRLALGLPAGSDLEYLDRVTIARALMGRREV